MIIMGIPNTVSLLVSRHPLAACTITYYAYYHAGCWITEDYGRERIGLEYIWLWLACLVNLICYVAIALVIKGKVFSASHPLFCVTGTIQAYANRIALTLALVLFTF